MLAGYRQLAARSWCAQTQLRALVTGGDAVAKADVVALAKELASKSQVEPVIEVPGQAFMGDYRSTSALGVGDGLGSHTPKWFQPELGGGQTTPMEYIQASEPIKCHGLVVASYGSDDPATGCPVEYINLKGTSREAPAVCKYTGNKYYSDDWRGGGGHH